MTISFCFQFEAWAEYHLFFLAIVLVKRPYRIPIPDWAAVLLAIPPCLGIFIVFLVSNWTVCIFNLSSIVFGYSLIILGESSKEKWWFSYGTEEGDFTSEMPTKDVEINEDASGLSVRNTKSAGAYNLEFDNEENGHKAIV